MLHRGDLVALPAPRQPWGHEQKGPRYGVVLQSSDLGALSTVLVAPTSMSAQPARFRPAITVRGQKTTVLVEQLRAIDRTHVGRSSGHLKAHELSAVDEAVKIVLGLY